METQVAGSYADGAVATLCGYRARAAESADGLYYASWNALRLQVSERTTCSSSLDLLAESAEGFEAIVTTTTTNNLYDVSLDVRVGPTGGSIDLKVPKARVQGGLYVGTLVGQTGSFNLGDIWATGRISAATGMVALEAVVCGCTRRPAAMRARAACRSGRMSPGVMCSPVMWELGQA